MLNTVSVIIPIAPGETAHANLLDTLASTNAEVIAINTHTRAENLNIGAQKATRPYLWFLHADTTLTAHNIQTLNTALQNAPQHLLYFNLAFDGFAPTKLNAWLTNLRSHVFGLPYGDQGFCCSKTLFNEVGPYPENTPFGEDLLFIRKLKRKGYKTRALKSTMITSARKYQAKGWVKLSLYRQYQLIKLLRTPL